MRYVEGELEGRFAEVEDICRLFDNQIFGGVEMSVRYDNVSERADVLIVDENFFEM